MNFRDFSEPEEGTTRRVDPSHVPRPLGFRVVVVSGPDQGAAENLVPGSPLLVGQSAACGLRLSDRTVSRRHVALSSDHQGVRVKDLGSTNGTYIEGVSIVEGHLGDQQTLRIGDTLLRWERTEQVSHVTPAMVTGFGRFLGGSAQARHVYTLAGRLANARVPVVIEGETGTGKEVLAEAIHEASDRSEGPFVVFDCTAVPDTLIEAELFGYERGAFTGANAARKGFLEQAHGGTLFVDEIGDLDLTLQPKLLRAIERSEFRRIGGDRSIRVDVRFLAATRRNLDQEVQAGRFRDDLFHRLAVGRIEIPPLRERKDDIALLLRAFWADLGGVGALPADLESRWADYPWPGNVRELRNAVARFIAVGDASRDTRATTSVASSGGPSTSAPDAFEPFLTPEVPLPIARMRVVEAFEQRYIERVLAAHNGNVSKAAQASGIGRRYFHMLKAKMK